MNTYILGLRTLGADMHCRYTAFALLIALLLAPAWATAADPPYEAPFIELGLGATNIEATVGNGGLTTGVSIDGDISVLSWPNPTYYDHIHYMTTNAPDARLRPRFGAAERMGAFAGIAYETGEGSVQTSWLRDDPWTSELRFVSEDTAVIEVTFSRADLGLTVRQIDVVPADRDVLIRRYIVERAADSPVQNAWLMSYANLSPGLSKVAQVPLLDALIDHKNDYLAVWNPDAEAIVHFHPNDTGVSNRIGAVVGPLTRDFGPLGELLDDAQPDQASIDALAVALDDHYAPGVYIAMGTVPAPVEFQIGEDPTDTCASIDELADNIAMLQETHPGQSLPADPSVADIVRCGDFEPLATPRAEEGWQYSAQDAFDDAADGALSGDRLAGAQANTALKTPLNFDASGQAQAAMIYGFGDTQAAAQAELDWSRDQDLQAVQDARIAADEAFVASLWIPEELTGEFRRFVKRTFLNMDVGTDEATGAIVASIARQPSYQLDWPRDGAFFNIALDLSGQHDLVTKRNLFYGEIMRTEKEDPMPLLNNVLPGWPDDPDETAFPPGSWEMNYYSDGEPGGNIRLEIDNTALLVWAFVYHVGHLDGQARADYIDDIWPTVETAANWLASWRDPETGLNWYANEDDHFEYTRGLQGASTTYGALVSAARMARHLGHDDLADAWLWRAGELKSAVLEHLYVDGEGFYGHVGPSKLGAGSPYWLSWPTHMFPADDERYLPQLKAGLAKHLADVRGETAGGQYPTKVAISAALVLPDGAERDGAYEIAERLATDIANPHTYTLGEHYSTVFLDDGDDEHDGFVNGVSTPHLWSMALVYLTAVAYHHPDRFDAYDAVLPEVVVPDVDAPGTGGEDAGGDAGSADVGVDTGGDTGTGGGGGGGGAAGGGDDGCGCSQPGRSVPTEALVLLGAFGLWRIRRRLGR